MKTATHSPAPWKAADVSKILDTPPRTYWQIDAGKGFFLSTQGNKEPGFSITGFMSEADARLIEAAPVMLKALQMMAAGEIPDTDGSGPVYIQRKGFQAIAKAAIDAAMILAGVE